MFNIDEVLAELAAGKSIEQIAQNAADVLNAAKAQHDKQEAERKAREKAEKKKEKSGPSFFDLLFSDSDNNNA